MEFLALKPAPPITVYHRLQNRSPETGGRNNLYSYARPQSFRVYGLHSWLRTSVSTAVRSPKLKSQLKTPYNILIRDNEGTLASMTGKIVINFTFC